MIARRWRGRIPAAKANEYLKLMKDVGLADYRSTQGNRGAWCLHRHEGDIVQIEMFTLWDDEAAIRRFAGADMLKAKYYAFDRDFLLEVEPEVTQFEVISPSGGLLAALLTVAVEIEDCGFILGLEKAQPARDFLIGLFDPAEVLAKTILVELLVGLDVPQPTAIGTDLIGQNDARVIAVPDATELELEVDQADSDCSEHSRQEVVYTDRHVGDVVHFVLRRPAEAGNMLVGDHRVAERVVLVIIFDDRSWQLRAFLDPETLRQGPGGDVADDDLDRDDFDLADELLAHVHSADEVCRNPDHLQRSEDVLGNAVVDDALAADGAALLRVERGRIVLEVLDERARLRSLVKDLGLSLINLAAASHGFRHSKEKFRRSGRYKRGGRCVLVRPPLGDQRKPALRGFRDQGSEYSIRFKTLKALLTATPRRSIAPETAAFSSVRPAW